MKFRPPLWATLLTLFAVCLFACMSWWQIQRGAYKADIIARQGDTQKAELLIKSSSELPEYEQHIRVSGVWQADQQVLLDNQTSHEQVGVEVWTPLRMGDDNKLILVNRGWLKASPYRDQWPDTGSLDNEEVAVSGYWRALPRAGISADDGYCASGETHWPQRLNYPSYALLQCLYQQPLLDGILLLDADAEDGFVREWADFGVPPQRHYGYAFQWAAMLLTVLFLYVFLNLKRTSP